MKIGRYLFDQYGGRVVFFGRFVSVLRTYAAFLAGTNRMPWRRFLVFNAAGGIVWAAIYTFGAYCRRQYPSPRLRHPQPHAGWRGRDRHRGGRPGCPPAGQPVGGRRRGRLSRSVDVSDGLRVASIPDAGRSLAAAGSVRSLTSWTELGPVVGRAGPQRVRAVLEARPGRPGRRVGLAGPHFCRLDSTFGGRCTSGVHLPPKVTGFTESRSGQVAPARPAPPARRMGSGFSGRCGGGARLVGIRPEERGWRRGRARERATRPCGPHPTRSPSGSRRHR